MRQQNLPSPDGAATKQPRAERRRQSGGAPPWVREYRKRQALKGRHNLPRAITLFAVLLFLPIPLAAQPTRAPRAFSPTDHRTASPRRPAPRFTDDRAITPTGGLSTAGDDRDRTSATPSLWKTLGALALIVGLIVVVGRLWRKHGPAITGGLPAEAIEVLGKRNLDARQAIHLVRLGSRILVLGSTAAGLRTLAEVTDPVEVDCLAGLCRRGDADQGNTQSFRALFSGRPVVDATREITPAAERDSAPDNPGFDHSRTPKAIRPQVVSGEAHG